jgi:hypothetical protein
VKYIGDKKVVANFAQKLEFTFDDGDSSEVFILCKCEEGGEVASLEQTMDIPLDWEMAETVTISGVFFDCEQPQLLSALARKASVAWGKGLNGRIEYLFRDGHELCTDRPF